MTLIIFNQCSDGQVIILDRKETNTSSVGQSTKKYFLPKNQEFILALSGDSLRIDTIFSALTLDSSINSENVIAKLDEIIKNSPIFGSGLVESSGLLLLRKTNSFLFYNVWFTNSQRSIVEENPPFKHYGEGGALADYLIRKFDLQNFTWEIACKYLISIMQEVSTIVDSVGNLERFGFDIIVITNNGEIRTCTLTKWDGKKEVDFSFTPDTDKNIECLSRIEPKIEFLKTGSFVTDEKTTEESTPLKISSGSITVKDGSLSYDVNYSISGGTVNSIIKDTAAISLILSIKSLSDGKIKIQIPRKLLDAKSGEKDEEFFVLIDGAESEYNETTTSSERTLEIQFPEGTEEIEIVGAELTLSSDKLKYAYGEKIILTITNFGETEGKSVQLRIHNKNGDILLEKKIPPELFTKWSYQEIIPIEGKQWATPKQEYRISVKSGDVDKEILIYTSDFTTKILLDQKVYTWTNRVNITVIAPELVRDHSKIENIGNAKDQQITISTRKAKLDYYRLEETGLGTGIFIGSILLTGFPEHDAIKNDKNKRNRGVTQGKGPNDGRISCSNSDGITITLKTPHKTISNSGLIRWNIAEIQWLKASYPVVGKGVIRLVDPDINLDPNSIDKVEIRVWSNSDSVGIPLILTETDKNTGIFKGEVFFTQDESNTPKLMVAEGDTIVAEYIDKTLPEPYSKKNELTISATSVIGTLVPPLERVSLNYASIVDAYGNHLAELSTGLPILVTANIHNNQTKSQDFAYIVQVQDDQSNDISFSSISGTLNANQSLSPTISWIPPREGEYKITIFIWESLENPTALSSTHTLKIKAVGEEKIGSQPKSIRITKNKIPSEQFAKSVETIIKIPQGSSQPGCQETDECYLPSHVKIKVNKTAMWVNDDKEAHTVTSGTPDKGLDGNFDSGLISSGTSFAYVFKKKGVYPYFCLLHPWQIGIIEIE